MRITGGALKGFSIACPPGIIRPAMDKMKESVFSILGDLSEKSFLDLFSGSGSIALEAASRGSRDIELCEKDKIKIPIILKNVSIAERILGVKIHCHFMSSELFLQKCKRQFNIIFFDPPFPYRFHEELLKTASERNVLSSDGIILIHRPQEKKLSESIGDLQKTDERRYGRSIVDFYGHKESTAPQKK